MKAWRQIWDAAQAQHAAFTKAVCNASTAQSRILMQIVTANRMTEFGRAHGFDEIRNYADFIRRVSISDYENMANDIQRISKGENDVLFPGVPLAFELTSGSSAGAKLIPYTAESLRSFQAAVLPWLANLIQFRPSMTKGRAYWAISPVVRTQQMTAAGIPIGMNDATYLGEDMLLAFAGLSVTPPHLSYEQDMQRWHFISLCRLASAADLSLVSVWNPSFFMRLIEGLQQHRDEVVAAIHQGYDDGVYVIAQNKARARLIGAAVNEDRIDTECLWPQLDLISCWTDGFAAMSVQPLRRAFPHVAIQGKGLLATEGVVTIPWYDARYPLLAINSGFYEFVDQDARVYRCDELREGNSYRVILTTPGGLYRYDIGDRMRCQGFYQGVPMLEFIGRAGLICDLAGEKLVEDFVAACLPTDRGFMQLTPRADGQGYLLVVDAHQTTNLQVISLQDQIETKLNNNPQYAYARRLGQLERLQVLRVARPEHIYRQWAQDKGQRLADIKPVALLRDSQCYANCTQAGMDKIERLQHLNQDMESVHDENCAHLT